MALQFSLVLGAYRPDRPAHKCFVVCFVCLRLCSCIGRSILFDQDGVRLFAGAHNVLKVFSWPSPACQQSLSVTWADVSDMALSQPYLVCWNYTQNGF